MKDCAVPLRIPLNEVAKQLERDTDGSSLLQRWAEDHFAAEPLLIQAILTANSNGKLLVVLDGLDETSAHLILL